MNKKRILSTGIVLAILSALVYFQVQHWRSFDWARFFQASHVDPLHIIAAIAIIYVTYVMRALRWRIFLQPVRNSSTARLVSPTFIGFTGLALLGRPGEFIRPYLIGRKENVSFSSQLGVWTVERIFDIGAFTVLMTIDVFVSRQLRGNPYIHKFQLAAVVLCAMVAFMSLVALLIRKRGHAFATFLHRLTSRISANLAHHVDQKVRAFGEGLNTISGPKAFFQLVAVSLAMWFLIALAYREVAHSYPHDPGQAVSVPVLDVETAQLVAMPESAGQELSPDLLDEIAARLQPKGFSLLQQPDGVWLMQKGKRINKIGNRPHLSTLDVSRVLLLMAFSMVGSIVQLPAVGGGSQLAVISALQLIYGIPPEMAVSCGMLLWLVTFMSVIPVGLAFARREHVSLKKLSEESAHQEEQPAVSTSPRP
jgi:uncharacterized protein (TIRG00374 family)